MALDDREEIGTADKPEARPLRLTDVFRRPFDIRSFALTGLFVLAVFYTMYFMRSMLLPLVLALLLSYLLAPARPRAGAPSHRPAAGRRAWCC